MSAGRGRCRPPGAAPFLLFGPLPDGSTLGRTSWTPLADPPDLGTGRHRVSIAVIRHDRDGVLRDTLGTFPGYEHFVLVAGSDRTYTRAAFSFNLVSASGGDRVFVGQRDAYEIEVYSPEGALERLIRLTDAVVPVSAEDIERYESDRLDAAAGDARRLETRQRILAEMEYPETFPAHGGLRVDAEGNLWVAAYRRPGEHGPSPWTVFDPEGRPTASVELPRGFFVHEIGEDYVLGRWTDELDVAHVRMYALEKPVRGS